MHKFFSNILQILATLSNNVQMYCIDVLSTVGVVCTANALGTRSYSNFSPVLRQSGVFIFFHKITGEVLYIGSSTALYRTSGGPGAVAQLINTDNPAIYNHFLAQNPNLAVQTDIIKRNSYDKYINDYSIFFFCLAPSQGNQTSFQADLTDITMELKSIINPTV